MVRRVNKLEIDRKISPRYKDEVGINAVNCMELSQDHYNMTLRLRAS